MSQNDPREAGLGAPAGGDDILHLRAARDAALQAAQTAVRDTTRLTRLLTILSDPAPLHLLLDLALSALSELFETDIVVLLDNARTGTYTPLAAIGLPEHMIHQPMGGAEHGYVFPPDWKPQAKSYARLSVSDTGCGLDPSTVDRIFDPFFSTKFTGRGLGLSLVLGLVKAHGGAITLESRPDHGTTFRLFFPEPVQRVLPLRKEEAFGLEGLADEGLVLLVDDEPMIRSMAGARLARPGYETITACDGLDALEKFRTRKNEFRLVLLDLTMPGMDGWETLAALRTLRADIPVVLAGGYDEAQVMRGDHSERPQAFLHKPYTMKDLQSTLSTALNAPATARNGT